jgi:hypothetical protein
MQNSDGEEEDRAANSPATTHSELSGHAQDVVQAREVRGGIHFHGVRHELGPIPRQLPADVRGFVNRTDDLERSA